MRRSVIS